MKFGHPLSVGALNYRRSQPETGFQKLVISGLLRAARRVCNIGLHASTNTLSRIKYRPKMKPSRHKGQSASMGPENRFRVSSTSNFPEKAITSFFKLSLVITVLSGVGVVALTPKFGFNDVWSSVSYYWHDLPGLPTFVRPKASIFLGHYFGDFTQVISMSRQVSPYQEIETFRPSQYPPLGHVMLLPLTFLPLRVAFILYFLGVLSLLVHALRQIWAEANTSWPLLGTISSMFVLTGLDRGNLVLISFACLLLAMADQNPSTSRKVVLIAIAISLKPYLVLFLPAMVRKEQVVKFVGRVSILVAALNVGSFEFFAGGTLVNGPVLISMLTSASNGLPGRFNHSLVASLPDPLGPTVFVFGFLLTFFLIARSPCHLYGPKLLLAAAGVLAFVPNVPAYQLVFALAPAPFILGEGRIPKSMQLKYTALIVVLLIPKQVEFLDSLNLAPFVDQFASVALWFLGLAMLRNSKSGATL